jgi:hypothetical protein
MKANIEAGKNRPSEVAYNPSSHMDPSMMMFQNMLQNQEDENKKLREVL